MNERCPCLEPAVKRCSRCGRPTCEFHWASQPVHTTSSESKAGKILLMPVCLPRCDDPQWVRAELGERINPMPIFEVVDYPSGRGKGER